MGGHETGGGSWSKTGGPGLKPPLSTSDQSADWTMQFHLRCLRKIARVKWQNRIPNTDVLNICGITGIEAFLFKARLRRVGHIIHMPDSCIHKHVFQGQLAVGKSAILASLTVQRHSEGQHEAAQDGPVNWAVTRRIAQPGGLCAMKRSAGSGTRGSKPWSPGERFRRGQPRSNLSSWPCDSFSHICNSIIGLHAHQQTRRWQAILRFDDTVHDDLHKLPVCDKCE